MAQQMISKPRELFLKELGDILYVERTLAQTVLPKLRQEVRDDELKQGFAKHIEQTRRHAEKVEQAFKQLGEKPKAEKCPGLEGLKTEHDEMIQEVTPELRDAVDAGAAARTEHYEIAAYGSLIAMARALREPEVVKLLQANLRQERDTLKDVERISKRLTKQLAAA